MSTLTPDLVRLGDVETWMFDEALPLWATVGRTPGLGFVEKLSDSGQPVDIDFKRMRVQARQIYVYSYATILGWPGLEAAADGLAFITQHGWLADGGWASRLGRDGGVIDATMSLYEQAFVMLALGWHARASGAHGAIDLAHHTLDAIHSKLRRAGGLGFRSDDSGRERLEQNPHMHLLEAMMALYETTGETRFLDEARGLMKLFEETLFQHDKGLLLEFFEVDGRPAEGQRGRIVEPGHHFEWVWLLAEYKRLTGEDKSAIACRLFDFAEAHGVAPDTGLVRDAVLDDGSRLDPDHRLWCQTEALKAHLVMDTHGREVNGARVAEIISNILDRYLTTNPRGLWIDHLTQSLTPKSAGAPATSLYHLFLAFAELRRRVPAR